MRHTARALIFCCAAAAGSALAAGAAVNVNFVNADGFSDTGSTPWDKKDNLDVIARHLQTLGQRYLGADQVLKVDVLDVDLAGENRFSRRQGTELRIAKGRTDFPKMTVRYSLESNGRVLQSGEERIADMDYLHRIVDYASSDPLRHEKQMLDAWFKARFVEHQPAGK